jgi:hypothetical protein
MNTYNGAPWPRLDIICALSGPSSIWAVMHDATSARALNSCHALATTDLENALLGRTTNTQPARPLRSSARIDNTAERPFPAEFDCVATICGVVPV